MWWIFLLPALAGEGAPLKPDRELTRLSLPDTSDDALRAAMRQAGKALGDWQVELSGVTLDGPALVALSASKKAEPFVRVVRESLGRPVDVEDLLYFLDDMLEAGRRGRRGERFVVTPGRARNSGIFLHPDDVFEDKPRVYGAKGGTLSVDPPIPQADVVPAVDGDPPGPGWTARFRDPASYAGELEQLDRSAPGGDFGSRIHHLLVQLHDQGAEVYVTSAVRDRTRGYLMWGAFELSRAKDARSVARWVKVLDQRKAAWHLVAPISWAHPDGWRATIEGARQMRETYDVVYATEYGARQSNHYGGEAVDLVALNLPRELKLTGWDGEKVVVDLSDPAHARDLSLEPELIEWIEKHYLVKKLKDDYPHWDDKSPRPGF